MSPPTPPLRGYKAEIDLVPRAYARGYSTFAPLGQRTAAGIHDYRNDSFAGSERQASEASIWRLGRDCVFFEPPSGLHAKFEDTWVRAGQGFVRTSAKVVRSPLVTVLSFTHLLREGRTEDARELVTHPEAMQDALDMGWARPRSRCAWSAGMPDPLGPNLDIYTWTLGEARREILLFKVYAEQQGADWLIDNIEPLVELSGTGEPCPAENDVAAPSP